MNICFVCFVALRSKSTAMVIAGRSVHRSQLHICNQTRYQLRYAVNMNMKNKIVEGHTIAYGFLRLWYKYELSRYSH